MPACRGLVHAGLIGWSGPAGGSSFAKSVGADYVGRMSSRTTNRQTFLLDRVHGWSSVDDLWEYASLARPWRERDPDAVILWRGSKQLVLWEAPRGRVCARGCLDLEHPAGLDWSQPSWPVLADAGVEACGVVGPVVVQRVAIDSIEDPRKAHFGGDLRWLAKTYDIPAWPIFEGQSPALTEALLDVVRRRYFETTDRELVATHGSDRAYVFSAPLYEGGGWRVYIEEWDLGTYLFDEHAQEPRRFVSREDAVAAVVEYAKRWSNT